MPAACCYDAIMSDILAVINTTTPITTFQGLSELSRPGRSRGMVMGDFLARSVRISSGDGRARRGECACLRERGALTENRVSGGEHVSNSRADERSVNCGNRRRNGRESRRTRWFMDYEN